MSNNVCIDDLWRRLVAVVVRSFDPLQAGQLKQLHAREFHHHHHNHNHDHLTGSE
jgi:peptide deformylase